MAGKKLTDRIAELHAEQGADEAHKKPREGGLMDRLAQVDATESKPREGGLMERLAGAKPEPEAGPEINETNWMVPETDPACQTLITRAKRLNIKGDPDQASHALGQVTLQDGSTVDAHVIHAVDSIVTDGEFAVAMINRAKAPAVGKPALPGGFIDPTKGGNVEDAIKASAREAMEEIGLKLDETGVRIGIRNFDRPYDVRIAANNDLLANYGVKKGDVFLVSTQCVRYDVEDLFTKAMQAGDDAQKGSARLVPLSGITRDMVGIPDHADMVHAAMMDLKINTPEIQKMALETALTYDAKFTTPQLMGRSRAAETNTNKRYQSALEQLRHEAKALLGPVTREELATADRVLDGIIEQQAQAYEKSYAEQDRHFQLARPAEGHQPLGTQSHRFRA